MSGDDNANVFTYTGQGTVPKDVTRVRVPDSVRTIAAGTFEGCEGLVEADLREGLEEIGADAFRRCESLARIAVPSTVRSIGYRAFGFCSELAEVELREGLEDVGSYAFQCCGSLKRVAIPASVTRIRGFAFEHCDGLFSITLPRRLHEIGLLAFLKCNSLRNISISSGCEVVGDVLFNQQAALVEAIGPRARAISKAIMHRFDELPIHQLCYDQQYHLPNETLQNLKEAIRAADLPENIGAQRDCLGMTPLHLLACSTRHSIGLYQFLIEKYPKNLIAEDVWGGISILYAFWGNVPPEIVQLLIQSLKTRFPNYVLDWGRMVITMAEANAPDGVQNLLHSQQHYFWDQTIDWEGCMIELSKSQKASVKTIQCLLRLGVSKRLDALAIERCRVTVEHFIQKFPAGRNTGEEQIRLLYCNLATYEQLKEAMWLLEIVLWKAKIAESRLNG
eukprot:CAMPEP_0172579180 /NCGR_PEP_ID=MMETSP1067-20121228/139114_1 /TAXON_ID=265564 ORGANISM="Thalassiosira punctigera, Strain Tpunct2005C2" /NCGR_SAMPLE_ID=MMETSP1067 /ASSEMBLY_ACC=CAM_ASM_000444 /LENGTH=448 /DNA_ID=CAMNT_0013371889 /DNA_START=78 /DNA_END=1420 /DNA_ORIENTATION=+